MKAVARPLNTSAGDWLIAQFVDPSWTSFRACVAYLKQSGSKHIATDLFAFTRRPGTRARLAVGISSQGTSLEGVQDLWRVLTGHGDFYIVHEGAGGRGSFHPKGYVFSNATKARLLIGSANLTEGGLFTNHELSVALDLDLSDKAAAAFFQEVTTAFDAWQTTSAFCLAVDAALIANLHNRGDLPSEATLRVVSIAAAAAKRTTAGTPAAGPAAPVPASNFGGSKPVMAPKPKALPAGLPPAPVVPKSPVPPAVTPPTPAPVAGTPTVTTAPPAPGGAAGGHQQFLIEVRPHHNGELFLSYLAIREDPAFFDYPFTGWTTPKQAHNKPYPQLSPDPVVEIVIYDSAGAVLQHKSVHPLNVVDYEPKSEIRVTIPDGMHRDIPEMSVLVLTKDPTPALDYRLEFYPPGSAPAAVTAKLTKALPSGGAPQSRHYGWS